MTARYELFVDAETLSENSLDATVIDFSAMIVDVNKMISDDPYHARDIAKVKRFKLDVDDQRNNYDTRVSENTLDFWRRQPPEVRKRIKPTNDDISVVDFVKEFSGFVGAEPAIKRVWCRNPAFDFILLKRLFSYDKKNIDDVIPFYIYRDVKTMVDVSFGFSEDSDNNFCPIEDKEFWDKIFQPHDSTWDVIADVLRYQAILRINNDLEMVKR